MLRSIALALLVAFAACLGGRSPRADPDAELRTQEIQIPQAVGASKLTIEGVDGKPASDPALVSLAPGRHTIRFEYKRCPPISGAACTIGRRDRLSLSITAIQGHRYVATARPVGRRAMVLVTDTTTGESTAALTPPDTPRLYRTNN
jgi:hypothetical protein